MRTTRFERATTWNFHISGIKYSTGLNYAPFKKRSNRDSNAG